MGARKIVLESDSNPIVAGQVSGVMQIIFLGVVVAENDTALKRDYIKHAGI